MISWVIALATLAFYLALAAVVYREWRTRAMYRDFPQYHTSWLAGNLLGNMELFFQVGPSQRENINKFLWGIGGGMTRMSHLNGYGLFHFRLGPFRHMLFFNSADSVEALLAHPRNISKGIEYNFIKPWLGNGLLTSTGSHWRHQRKLLTPSFHFQILHNFIPLMNGQVETFLELLESRLDQKTSKVIIEDIRPLVTNLTVDIICETAMGIKVNAQKESNVTSGSDELQYIVSLREILHATLKRTFNPLYVFDWIYFSTHEGREYRRHVKTLHDFTMEVIRKRRAEFEAQGLIAQADSLENSIQSLSSQTRKRLAFLDLMLMVHLASPNEFDLASLREEVDTFMFGGHDTTSSALQFALLLLGLNPDKQTLIHEELDSIFSGDSQRPITAEDLRQMTYMECAVKETLRYYPPAAFFARLITEPFQSGPYKVPAGCTAMVNTYAIHHDPRVWPNPEKFEPERFLDSTGRNPFAFIPFSAGLRNCIGQKFAMLELKLTLAAILRRFHVKSLSLQHDVQINLSIISKPVMPICLEFSKRT